MIEALFEADGDRFIPTHLSRGPWSLDSLHGGPPSALIARHLEALAPEHMDLVRLTVEILRPVPVRPLSVTTKVTRPGRKVTNTAATLTADGQTFATATAVHIRRHPGITLNQPPMPELSPPAGPSVNALPVLGDNLIFSDAVEARYVGGHGYGPGPTSLWMRMKVPTVAGTSSSPFEQVVPLADCGNGLSWWEELSGMLFPNPDLTVYLHRQPVDDWILLESSAVWESAGIGLAQSRLSDRNGLIGRSLQSLYLDRP